jgi:hypothetical protein
MFDLKEPVPTPMMIKPIRKDAREFVGWTMTGGVAEMTKMMWPRMAIASAMHIVL